MDLLSRVGSLEGLGYLVSAAYLQEVRQKADTVTSRELESLYDRMGKPTPEIFRTPSANKYSARKKMVDGILFDSSGEARAYQILKLQEQAGIISNLELQPEYVIIPKSIIQKREVIYRADFRFVRDGRTIVCDYKGFETRVFKIKRSMLLHWHPEMNFEVWTKADLK